MNVRLGNVAAKEKRDGKFESLKGGERETSIEIPEGTSLSEAFVTITASTGVWANHSDKPAAWVESDNEALRDLLCAHFGCKPGRPKKWGQS